MRYGRGCPGALVSSPWVYQDGRVGKYRVMITGSIPGAITPARPLCC